MGAEIIWLGASEPASEPEIVLAPADEIATGTVCDRHPSARAEYWSPRYSLAFCAHCARCGAARELPLEPMGATQ